MVGGGLHLLLQENGTASGYINNITCSHMVLCWRRWRAAANDACLFASRHSITLTTCRSIRPSPTEPSFGLYLASYLTSISVVVLPVTDQRSVAWTALLVTRSHYH